MRSVTLLAVFLLLAFLSPSFGGLAWETTIREIRIPANQKEVLADFGFKNSSSVPIGITSIQTSCGCTSAKTDKTDYAAGEAGAVHVRFDVGGRKGEQVKSVLVKTSDREKQTLVLRVLVQEAISFNRRDFVWAPGAPAVPQATIVEIDPASGAQILGVESLNDQFDVKFEEIEPGSRYRIQVTPRSTEVPVTSSIKVRVADPKQRSILLQTRVEM